jgi:hypothetical protein
MDPGDAVIWMFLGIFVMTALIALGALVGWVSLQPYYKKNLFRLLILEVVGCVVGFGGAQAIGSRPQRETDLRTTLVAHDLGWDAQYAENGWRSRIRFESTAEGKLSMMGSTYLAAPAPEAARVSQPILIWESSEPFEVPADAHSVTFKARRSWTEAAATVYPQLQWELGKKTDVLFTVKLESALSGAVTNATSAETWGLVLTPAFP